MYPSDTFGIGRRHGEVRSCCGSTSKVTRILTQLSVSLTSKPAILIVTPKEGTMQVHKKDSDPYLKLVIVMAIYIGLVYLLLVVL